MLELPASWVSVLGPECDEPYFGAIRAFLEEERSQQPVFPPDEDVFAALRLTAFEDVRVVILGQDPYHDDGQAHGLAFSVRPGVPPPPSLVNIFRELADDVGCPKPGSGSLLPWARRGVLLLNTVLTVRAHEPNSHRGRGWEAFTDAILRAVARREHPSVFVLWGSHAQKRRDLADPGRNPVILSAHPSPLSARRGFFGSKPFSRSNAALRELGESPIDWCLPTD